MGTVWMDGEGPAGKKKERERSSQFQKQRQQNVSGRKDPIKSNQTTKLSVALLLYTTTCLDQFSCIFSHHTNFLQVQNPSRNILLQNFNVNLFCGIR